MITQTRQPPGHAVTAARFEHGNLYVQVAGRWARVGGKRRFLDDGAMILLSEDGDRYFATHYLAHYHGDPADSAAPMDVQGMTTDPVVAYLAERWLADYLPVEAEETVIPVPTLAQARAALPGLRARRHAA